MGNPTHASCSRIGQQKRYVFKQLTCGISEQISGVARNVELVGHYRGGYIHMLPKRGKITQLRIRMGSHGTFVLCTASSRCTLQRDVLVKVPSIDSTSACWQVSAFCSHGVALAPILWWRPGWVVCPDNLDITCPDSAVCHKYILYWSVSTW